MKLVKAQIIYTDDRTTEIVEGIDLRDAAANRMYPGRKICSLKVLKEITIPTGTEAHAPGSNPVPSFFF